ncbi:MAG: ATP-dependent helicase HrpB [Planctomycetota bacterium]
MKLEPLPIDEAMPRVLAALQRAATLLLMAPPGSGKTTRVPSALLPLAGDGEIVVLEPRRLAARAAAQRVADEMGTRLGDLVGYQVRGDKKVSAATRIRFVTEGVLVRQLVQDPFLERTAIVCLDEFHERHLEGDLALAMLNETRQTVRDDLKLCVMSATLDPGPLQRFLAGAEVVEADGRLYPVEVVHLPRAADGPLEVTVRDAVDRALDETAGDVLVFLPGVGEISRCQQALDNLQRRRGVEVLPLHGKLDLLEQTRAIQPQQRRKVVLSTNVAESSLTIAGVTAVVDSGLARELRFDRGRGVDVLEKTRISQASAMQRAGRAGRTAAGKCYRLWSAAEERGMPAHALPDVQRVDLCGPALSVRAFAGRDPVEFGWFEAPPRDALHQADELLRMLGAIDQKSGRLLPFGEQLLGMSLHPRLGAVVLEGRRLGCAVAAATAAVLLSDVEALGRGGPRGPMGGDGGGGADLHVAVDAFLAAEQRGFPDALCREFGSHPGPARALLQSRNRLLGRGADRDDDRQRDTTLLNRCLLRGFPDRVVKRAAPDQRNEQQRVGTMVGGRGVTLPAAADGEDLVLALRLHEAGRQQRSSATLTAAITIADLEAVEADALIDDVTAELDEANGKVFAVRQRRYRDLPLRRARGGEVPAERAYELLQPLLAAEPWRWLGEQKDLRRLLDRMRWLGERVPELAFPADLDGLVASAAMDLLTGNDLKALRDAKLQELLLAKLTGEQRRALQQQAPDRIELPTGRAAIVDYGAEAGPTVSARLQEFFGLPAVQKLAGGRVPVVLELLAPNHRPVQVTTDLPSFWQNVYPSVRKELSRKYPRHSWPEDPLAASPESRPKPRRRS